MELVPTVNVAPTYGDWAFIVGICVFVLTLAIIGFFMNIFKD